MQQKHTEEIMVVVLNDLVKQSIPRICAINQKLGQGEVLNESEIDFFQAMLKRLRHCYHHYADDKQCLAIYSCIAHMLYEVINLAHDNEQKTIRAA